MKIGLCTGVFDLLHQGHINFLTRAQIECDVLLVAVASDWLTRVQKGWNRPVNTAGMRCEVIRALGGKMRVFETDKLDFRDYDFVDLMILGEGQVNVRWNGPSVTIPRTPGISTSDMIKERGLR